MARLPCWPLVRGGLAAACRSRGMNEHSFSDSPRRRQVVLGRGRETGGTKCSMTTTQVAVVQMTSKPDLALNLDAAERLVRKAAHAGAKLVVLPECFAWIGPDGSYRQLAERLPVSSRDPVESGPVL